MSLILNLSALGGVSLLLSLRFRESLARTVPVALCSALLLLYVLAFFRKMPWLDAAAALCLAALAVLFGLRCRRDGFLSAAKTALGPLRDVQVWVNLAALLAVALLVNYRQILEWDAYNFWGADIKSLFYRGGFAEKNSNPAAAFGDYPPLMQLAVWWFLHLFGRFDEGLVFSGYYAFGMVLLLSLTDRPRFSGAWQRVLGGGACAALLFLLPGVGDTSWYRALYADPVMGLLFGCLLTEIAARQASPGFALYKWSVLGAAVCLTKSIGFMWAAFGVLFLLIWHGLSAGTLKKAAVLLGTGGLCYGSWAAFCKILSRTTYLSDSIGSTVGERAAEILNGTFLSAGDNLGYIKSFVKAFLFAPVHREWTPAVDLTPGLVVLLILGLLALFRLGGWLTTRQAVKLALYFIGICGVTYFVLLCGHLSIFYAEKKYLDPMNMVVTMTRYGCPAATGFLMLAFAAGAERWRWGAGKSLSAWTPWVLPVVILLCAGYNDVGRCIIRGADQLDPQRIQLRAKYQESMADFLAETAGTVPLEGEGQRVLLVMKDGDYNPIISYLAAPVSIQKMGTENFSAEGFQAALEAVGARWFYVREGEEEALEAVKELAPEAEAGRLYPTEVLKARE